MYFKMFNSLNNRYHGYTLNNIYAPILSLPGVLQITFKDILLHQQKVIYKQVLHTENNE